MHRKRGFPNDNFWKSWWIGFIFEVNKYYDRNGSQISISVTVWHVLDILINERCANGKAVSFSLFFILSFTLFFLIFLLRPFFFFFFLNLPFHPLLFSYLFFNVIVFVYFIFSFWIPFLTHPILLSLPPSFFLFSLDLLYIFLPFPLVFIFLPSLSPENNSFPDITS